ncbi:MAG: TatD family hydrolase [Nitrososphaerales archaeon]
MGIIDPHIHMYSRTTDDYEKMALAGIKVVIEPSFWLGSPRTSPNTMIDYWENIINFEPERAQRYGIEHYCMISVNPKEANNAELASRCIEIMPKYLDKKSVTGLGEIGFDQMTQLEEMFFRKQLKLAKSMKVPVMIHTPHNRKLEGTARTIEIIKEEDCDEKSIIIDHNTEETISICLRSDVMAGISLYPKTKMSSNRAINLIRKYGTERILLNSSADWGDADPLSVPRAVMQMRLEGFKSSEIEKIVFENPYNFFKQSRNFTYRI